MKRFSPKFLLTLFLLLLAASTGAWALDSAELYFLPSGEVQKVSADTNLIDFGVVAVNGSSEPFTLLLTNDENVPVTVLGLTSSDQGVSLFDPLILEPTTLSPGQDMEVSLQYTNSTTDAEITGTVTVHTLGGGSESTNIDFIVNEGVAGDGDEEATFGKPNEGWFLGPCFISSLLLGR